MLNDHAVELAAKAARQQWLIDIEREDERLRQALSSLAAAQRERRRSEVVESDTA